MHKTLAVAAFVQQGHSAWECEDKHGYRCGNIDGAEVTCNTGRCCSNYGWCDAGNCDGQHDPAFSNNAQSACSATPTPSPTPVPPPSPPPSPLPPAPKGDNQVWLSTGYGGWDHQTLQDEWNKYQSYAQAGAITRSSLLMYGINADGSLMSWETGDKTWTAKQFQKDLKSKLGLGAHPTLFCDETIGNCKPLATGLSNIFNNPQIFIDATIAEAKQHGWDGFAVDLESFSSLPTQELDSFLIKWGEALNNIGKELSIWIGGPTQYSVSALARSSAINSLVTMNTYTGSRSSFESSAQGALNAVGDPSKTGFGLLTSDGAASMMKAMGYGDDVVDRKMESLQNSTERKLGLGQISQADMLAMSSWAKSKGARHFHVWASEIPSTWIEGLKDFVGSGADQVVV